jgi:hypothetical protein
MAIWTCHDHRLFELSTSLWIIFFQASRAKVPWSWEKYCDYNSNLPKHCHF